jgi:L-fuculose-phosphate aldolase
VNLIEAAQELDRLGFMPSKSGNLSFRTAKGFTITPSGVAYAGLTEGDLVQLDHAGGVLGGRRTPSSEWRLHQAIHAARPDAKADVEAALARSQQAIDVHVFPFRMTPEAWALHGASQWGPFWRMRV